MTSKQFTYLIITLVLVLGLGYFALNTNAPTTETPDTIPTVGEKLNINEICEEALAYTTFPNGEAADKFVAECKEGKHPEVIEDYKQRMNLGDGAAI